MQKSIHCMKIFCALPLLIALAACGKDETTSDNSAISGEKAKTAVSPGSEELAADTVNFQTPPAACGANQGCEEGQCATFTTVDGWKDKSVCVTGDPCSHVTCGTGKTCWVNEPGILQVVCGEFSTPSDGDAGPPAIPPPP